VHTYTDCSSKSDTSTGNSDTGLGGQGSHFRRDEAPTALTETDPSTAAPSGTLGQSSVGHHDQSSSQGQGHRFPSTLRANDESGTAAIGTTSTYSSQPLASGDPTGSVVDHQSTDPLTYKLPEAGSRTSAATQASGSTAPSNAASTAASLAWNKSKSLVLCPLFSSSISTRGTEAHKNSNTYTNREQQVKECQANFPLLGTRTHTEPQI